MSCYRFPKNHRILKKKEFSEILTDGERRKTKHFVLFIKKRTHDGKSRLGLIITKKIGNAVVRNRIKRVVREFFRLHYREIASGDNQQDIIFIARRGSEKINLKTLRDEIQKLYENHFYNHHLDLSAHAVNASSSCV